MKLMKTLTVMVSALGLASCGVFGSGKYEIVRVTAENDAQVKGVRFFSPRPYLVVSEDELIINGVTKREPLMDGAGHPRVDADGKPMFSESSEAVIADGKKNRKFRIIWMPDPSNAFAIVGDIAGRSVKMASGWKLLEFDNKIFFAEDAATEALVAQINGAQLEPGLYELQYREGVLIGMKRVICISGG